MRFVRQLLGKRSLIDIGMKRTGYVLVNNKQQGCCHSRCGFSTSDEITRKVVALRMEPADCEFKVTVWCPL